MNAPMHGRHIRTATRTNLPRPYSETGTHITPLPYFLYTIMDLAQYRRINTIIERDSADATYKYALLRGVTEICQQSSHLREDDGDQVSFPARI
jgi:hypothetical protein